MHIPIHPSSEEVVLEQAEEVSISTKRRGPEEDQEAEDHKKSRVEEGKEGEQPAEQEEEDMRGYFKADGVEFEVNFKRQKPEANDKDDTEEEEQYFFGKPSSPPPPLM